MTEEAIEIEEAPEEATEETTEAISLLEDIDRRQNEVLQQLDELNTQVEGLIKRHLPPKRELTPAMQPAEAA